MATRSAIGIRLNNGKIKAVYCHYDGYPEGVGKTLFEHYDGGTNATKLISLGDISVLDKSMTKPAGHTFNKPVEGYSVFYGRDRGEKNTKAKIYDSVKDIFDKLGSEYVYVSENNQWMYASEDNQELRPLIDNMSKGGGVDKLPANLKKRLDNANKIIVSYGGRPITVAEAISFNSKQMPQSGWNGGFKAFELSNANFGSYRYASKKELETIGDALIDISREMSGKDIYAKGGMVFRNTYDMVAAAKKLSNSENYSVLSDKEGKKYMLVPNEKVSKFEKEGNLMKIGRINSDGNFRRLSSDGNKMATGGGVGGYYFEVEKEGDKYSVYFYKPSGDLDWGKQGFSTQQEAQMYGEENIEKYKTKYPKPNLNYEDPTYFDDSNFNYDNWASTDKMATGGEISAVEDWVGMDYGRQEIEMVLDALEKADISFPEDTRVENAYSIEDETRQTAEMTDDFYNEIEEYCPTLDEKAIKEILWGVIHASKNYDTTGSQVTYSNFDMMEGSSNTQDLQVFETKLRILTTNWLNEGFEKEEILEYIEHLLDQI